jgi:phosphoserine phosphatase RsbU/P
VMYAVFDLSLDRVHVASAGHPPPVIAAPGQAGVLADIAGGLMIGVDAGTRRRTTTIKIAPGTVLCFYTDGLVERREFPLDEGLARLCHAVVAEPPDAVCASVMGALVGADVAPDDIALLILRREPLGGSATAGRGPAPLPQEG